MRQHAYHTAFFDLDGTLLDHFTAIHRAHCHARRHFGLSEPTMEDVHRAVGAGVILAIERIFAHDHPELVPQAIPVFREYWDKNLLDGVALLPGAREVLDAARCGGARCAVLTNKHGPSSRKVCEYLGIAPLLDGVFGAADTAWLKPQREFVGYALEKMGLTLPAAGVPMAGVCLIGDSIYDAQTGLNAGFPCYCVTTGTHTEAELRAAKATGVYTDLFAVARDIF